MSRRVIVVGARSTRQGTGPFIAGAIKKSGAEVVAVVGTQTHSVESALASLATEQDIRCRGYTDLNEAIASEQPDAVAICSPYPFHLDQLQTVAAAGCHCLVEKPLVWPGSAIQVSRSVEHFSRRGLLLQMVAQWPLSLVAFAELNGPIPQMVNDFTMRLSPVSIGPNMVPDSAPHFISMLQALLGPGQCEQVEIELIEVDEQPGGKLALKCNYRHDRGVARAQLLLETCEQRPRPAWYQINGMRVDRKVELPHYAQCLVAGERSVSMKDPMEGVVEHFLAALTEELPTDVDGLVLGHRNLTQLADAWPAAD
jgi:hypothetical protein